MTVLKTDIGAFVKAEIGTDPLNDTGGTVNGPAIDRSRFQSCILVVAGGVATGAPTAQTLDSKLQESALAAGPFTDITDAAITQITADSTIEEKDVNLRTAKKFVRVVTTVVLTAGTAPAWPRSANVMLGGALNEPV